MSEAKSASELATLARDFASRDVDLYDVLGLGAVAASSSADAKAIQTGFRRQSLLKHPDKAGKSYDASAWTLIQQAKDVLLDASARTAYDQARGATLLRKQEKEKLGKEQRRYADELEAAERDARRKKAEEAERERALGRKREEMREEMTTRRQREDEEERERVRLAEEVARPSLDEQEAELVRKLEAKARKRGERAQRKKERAERRGDKEPSRVSAYYFSTDPKLSYDEKVAGVMAKLRARQRERDGRPAGADHGGGTTATTGEPMEIS